MKIFTNKNLIQKLIVAIVIVTLLEFCIAPLQVNAATIGGTLAKPIRDLAVTIGDALISLTQYGVTGTWLDAVERNYRAKHEGVGSDYWSSTIRYPIIQLSPELIFANEVEILDANFVTSGSKDSYIISATQKSPTEEGKENNTKGALEELRIIIASWYVTLRTLAVVGLLSVLIYIGIRIIISSTGQDKAKYKQRLIDWIVAFCILFFMHYIMIGLVTIIEEVNKTLSNSLHIGTAIPLNSDFGQVIFNKQLDLAPSIESVKASTVEEWVDANGYTIEKDSGEIYEGQVAINSRREYTLTKDGKSYKVTVRSNQSTKPYRYSVSGNLPANELTELKSVLDQAGDDVAGDDVSSGSSELSSTGISINEKKDENTSTKLDGAIETTNSKNQTILVSSDAETEGKTILYYINYARLYCNAHPDYNAAGFAFTTIYLILVVFTVMFTFRYVKRVIYIAFLTMIAPLVALTYPLDKIKDGKAQAFNLWFREYIFNLLIQPFHLLLYTILVGSATSLANQHMIYAVVAIAFLIPAEKLLRKFFGFDNAGTLSAAGSFAGGALFSTMISKINKGSSSKSGGNSGNNQQKPVRKITPSRATSSDILVDGTLGGVQTGGTPTGGTPTGGAPTGNTPTRDTQTGNVNSRIAKAAAQRKAKAIKHNITGSEGTDTIGDDLLGKGASSVGSAGGNNNSTSFMKRIENAAGSYLYSRSRRAIEGAKTIPRSAGRMVRRAAFGTIPAAALALTGAAVGAASGDAGAAMKLATAGAGAGYYGANRYGDSYASGVVEDLKGAEASYWGKDMREKEAERFDEKWKNDPRNRDDLTKAIGDRALVDEAINDGTIQKFLDNGQSNPGMIGKGIKIYKKYQQRGYSNSSAMDMALASLNLNKTVSNRVLDPYSRERKDLEEGFNLRLTKAGLTGAQAKIRIQEIIDDLNEINT